jgi:predicted TIM-barrel fold metal-dependent hydrolase
MSIEPRAYPHPHVNEAWLARLREAVLEPELPVIDAHHHLWDRDSGDYFLNELLADITAGHDVRATVFVQCAMAYRTDGPDALRPVGETEFVVAIGEEAARRGHPGVCAGIVGHCDMRLAEGVDAVLEAHLAAGKGRFRGIRHSVGWDAAIAVRPSAPAVPGMFLDPAFQRGVSRLRHYDLSYEASFYYPQLPELTALARSLPDVAILANHCGGPLCVGPHATDPAESFARWRAALRELAACPNVMLKLGGQAMPIRGWTFDSQQLPPSSGELATAWRPVMETCIEAFGADRCLFESNFPVDKGMCGYVPVWNAFKRIAAACSETEKAALFHGTALRFYRLDPGLIA